jgi:hypothetical protein
MRPARDTTKRVVTTAHPDQDRSWPTDVLQMVKR